MLHSFFKFFYFIISARKINCSKPLRQKPAIRGDICSESPPKVCEIDMAQGEDMSKGPGTEEIMFLSAFILEI